MRGTKPSAAAAPGRADPHPPAEHRAQLAQVGARNIELGEDLAGPGQEQLTRLGERDPPGGALELIMAPK